MKEFETTPPDIIDLIASYLFGNITHEGLKKLIRWMHSSDENKQLFNQLNDIWQATATGKEFEKLDVQKHWEEVLMSICKKQPNIGRRIISPRSYGRLKRFIGIAAAVVIIFGAGMFVQNMRNEPVENKIAKIPEFIEVSAPIGSRAHVVLTDGSKVWLNAGTKLRYSNEFGKTDRDVALTGEAYFTVAKRADLPFVIQAADIKITALGTVFNVKAYAEEGHIETSLESGSVKIERVKGSGSNEADQPPIILRPNEKVSLLAYTSDEKEKKSTPVKTLKSQVTTVQVAEPVVEKLDDIRISTSWKDSNWVIRDESMKSLAVKLGRRYDVNFVFKDKDLEKYKFSATLRDETLEQVLNMIQISAPIKYTIQEKNVYLSLNSKYKKAFEESIQ